MAKNAINFSVSLDQETMEAFESLAKAVKELTETLGSIRLGGSIPTATEPTVEYTGPADAPAEAFPTEADKDWETVEKELEEEKKAAEAVQVEQPVEVAPEPDHKVVVPEDFGKDYILNVARKGSAWADANPSRIPELVKTFNGKKGLPELNREELQGVVDFLIAEGVEL